MAQPGSGYPALLGKQFIFKALTLSQAQQWSHEPLGEQGVGSGGTGPEMQDYWQEGDGKCGGEECQAMARRWQVQDWTQGRRLWASKVA